MKIRKILCTILILLSTSLAAAKENRLRGIELSTYVHTFLKQNGFSPAAQSLVVSGENTFPYNIIVTFTPKENSSPENLLLVFFQEDLPDNKDTIGKVLKEIREKDYPFTISVLFAYGEKQILQRADMIYGTQVFLESLNTNLSYSAVIFDLDSKTSDIETTSDKKSSPPRLIKNAMNLYKENGLSISYPPIILSQLSSYSFISSTILSRFFEYDIPAIKLSLNRDEIAANEGVAERIISGFVELYSKSADSSWEGHFMIVRLFGSYHTISEKIILHIVIPVILVWLIFIFTLVFVNRRLKKHTWYTIGNVWWSVPLTFFLITIGFLLGRFFFLNLSVSAGYAGKVYGQLIFELCISLLLTLSAYLIILTVNHKFNERSIDYLLVISCFINQSVFILADISLSPIFIIICLLSLFALTIKNNYLHIALFGLMILPLIPYVNRMINAADLMELSLFLAQSKGLLIFVPLVLYPVFIVLFRILAWVRSRYNKISALIITTLSMFVFITSFLVVFGIIRTHSLNKKQTAPAELKINPDGEQYIELTVTNKDVFDDTIRKLEVSLKKDCIFCDILITTERENPILYSDDDFTNPSAHQARLSIPDNPPNQMTFTYGAAKGPGKITVSAVYEDEITGGLKFISRTVETGVN